MSFEEIEHTADRAFRVQGRNFAELLENAARAMSSLDRLGPSGTPSVVRTSECISGTSTIEVSSTTKSPQASVFDSFLLNRPVAGSISSRR
jgi:hypothetical protein